ncbi:MAG: hypothetical protein ABR555_09585 [Pyrinomonadaceae bacterium]
MLNGLSFSMVLKADGTFQLDHQIHVAAPNAQVADGYKQIIDGMEKFGDGFFSTWNIFMLTKPFPEPKSNYQLQSTGETYLLTYKDGQTDVKTNFNRDFSIANLSALTSDFDSLVEPRFTKTPNGYVISGYSGHYTPASGAGKVVLDVQIAYVEVEGLQLPKRIHMKSTIDGNPNVMEIELSNYQVRKNN